MPVIRISFWDGKTIEQKRELVEVLTKETARITGGSIDSVYVIIEEVKKDDWGVSGQLSSDKFPD